MRALALIGSFLIFMLIMNYFTTGAASPGQEKPKPTPVEVRYRIANGLLRYAKQANEVGMKKEEMALRQLASDLIKPETCITDSECEGIK